MRVPLYIELENKNVLIVGGGKTGTSRAKKFLSAGANVTVLSLDFSSELLKLGSKIKLINGSAFDFKLLNQLMSESVIVVVALPTTKINEAVMEIAKKHRVLVNLANDADKTEVVVPFETEVDGLRVAITSEGKSGVVVKEALRRVTDFLKQDREIFNLLELMWHLKRYMKTYHIPVKTRMKLYFEVFENTEFRELVLKGKLGKAKEKLESIVKGERNEGS